MDPRRFDAFTKTVAAAHTRRQLLRTLAGGAAALLRGGRAGAAACGDCGALTCCDGACVELGTDQNCARCGDACTEGQTCISLAVGLPLPIYLCRKKAPLEACICPGGDADDNRPCQPEAKPDCAARLCCRGECCLPGLECINGRCAAGCSCRPGTKDNEPCQPNDIRECRTRVCCTERCCPKGWRCWGGQCCPKERQCRDAAGNELCCPDPDEVCCADTRCCFKRGLPSTPTSGEICVGHKCCPHDRACRNETICCEGPGNLCCEGTQDCCAAPKRCLPAATGGGPKECCPQERQRTVPPDCCLPNQISLRDVRRGGREVCCRTGPGPESKICHTDQGPTCCADTEECTAFQPVGGGAPSYVCCPRGPRICSPRSTTGALRLLATGGGTQCCGTDTACTDDGCCPTGQVCGTGCCQSGCCDGTSCQPGTADTACGTGGSACTDCTTSGQTCASGVCQGACGSGETACVAGSHTVCCPAGFPTCCPPGSSRDCCPTGFAVYCRPGSSRDCCPIDQAVCCPPGSAYDCCPTGTTCTADGCV